VTLRLRATAATPRPKNCPPRKARREIDPKAGRGKRDIYWVD